MKRPAIWRTNNKTGILAGGLIILLVLGAVAYRYLPSLLRSLPIPPGQDISAAISLEHPGPYRIGDLIPMRLEIQARDGISFTWPDLASNRLGQLELRARTTPQTVRYRGGSGQKCHYTLTGWATGCFTIPALQFQYRTKAGQTARYTIPARKITIVSVLPKGKSKAQLLALKLKGTKAPAALPPNYHPLWSLVVIGGVIAAILLGLYWWRRFHSASNPEIDATCVTQEPAHVIAMRRLEALHGQACLGQDGFKAYYTELSECLREYLENRFQIKALEMTTEEFLSYLSSDRQLPTASRTELRNFLKTSDLIKFAKHLPEQSEAEAAWDQVYEIVDTTKPEPVETEPIAGQG